MAIEPHSYTLADPEVYAPIEQATNRGRRYRPTSVPGDWVEAETGIWTAWRPADGASAEQGWKVHVSAQFDRAQHVLNAVASACFDLGVPFKHISAELFFLYLHHKHGPRPQSGKFCACYPGDEDTARRLMDRLIEALADEHGPYVLTDRRYPGSRVVHYRYGAFQALERLRPDGGTDLLVRNGSGGLEKDTRTTSFVLPPGITDPFTPEPAAPKVTAPADPVPLRGYRVLRALAHSNAGGAYEGEAPDGRRVFIKEARAHNGLYWDHSTAQQRLRREYEVLRRIHAAAPGLCPEPIEYFREWEHEFLVTEFIEGTPLNRLPGMASPVVAANRGEREYTQYYARCTTLLDGLRDALDRLHGLGLRFGDLSPGNVMVTEHDTIRLIDFEATSHVDDPPVQIGTDGYVPPGHQEQEGAFSKDEYGFAASALFLLLPVHPVAERHPDSLAHLHADLAKYAPVPHRLWRLATRNYRNGVGTSEGTCLPTPTEVATDPHTHLRGLAERVVRDLLGVASPEHPHRVFPTAPRGHATNTLCVAYGTAGVVHALHHAGVEIPAAVLDRFRRDALDQREQLPPGLHVGAAGAAWVLAETGLLDEASALLATATDHPLTLVSTTLGEGIAGVGMAQLALHHTTGEHSRLEHAAAIGESILGTTDLTPTLGANDAVGLLHGRAGIALFLYYLSRATADPRYLKHGVGLLHDELARGIELHDGALSFPDDAVTNRAMPYLFAGSAGVGAVLTRYVTATGDERLSAALPRVVADATKLCTAEPGLYAGLAGLAYFHADHADHADHAGGGQADIAVRLATGLFKYAVPTGDGVRFLGEGSMRYSAELWSGSAGVLLAVDRVLHGNRDQFFTLDLATGGDAGRAARSIGETPAGIGR